MCILVEFHVDFRVDIHLKAFRQQVHKAADPAASQRRISSLKLHVKGGLCDSGDRVFPEGKAGKIILLIVFGKNNLLPDHILRKQIGVHHAFICLCRHSPRREHHAVHALRQGMYLDHALVVRAVPIQNIRRIRARNRPHIFLSRKHLHIHFLKSEGGKQPEIIKLFFFQIMVSRRHHHISRHLQAGKQADSESHNGKNGKISAEALLDFP